MKPVSAAFVVFTAATIVVSLTESSCPESMRS